MISKARQAALVRHARTGIMLTAGLVALVAFLVFGPLGLIPEAGLVGSSTDNS